ncbi:MAG: class I SAM-dependent DNA methyltransferase [Bacteroidota bacterium]|nr:class I SAM-dependent DNA methyltransferase [Bacteroidota bacterium]
MNFPTLAPHEFIAKWRASQLKESSAAQEHFIDLCRLLDEPTPAEIDPKGDHYCFERGARKDSGGEGWADVWKRGFFAWEYKGKHANLDTAFDQLRQYALALENPPLLIVSDMHRFRIRTNWTNSVSETHEFVLDELVDSAVRDKLKWAMSDPDRLRPRETRQTLTERAAKTFAQLAQSLRDQGHAPEDVAHFVNRLVFCMFAEDVGLLPNNMFTRMLENARDRPEEFAALASTLFRAMSVGGNVGFETVKWFNGGLFENEVALPMDLNQIRIALNASKLDWSNIDPSILGTLFERGLDPDKRSQLGAHYTDRDKIMRIIDPVIVHPWLAEWKTEKARIVNSLERARVSEAGVETRHRKQAKNKLNSFLERLRNFTVLDPACGSGNFLYLALHTMHDLEHRVQLEAEALGLPRAFPMVGPANVKGIELNTYAAELARVSVWIGEIQWMRRNGFSGYQEPILGALDTIECRDAILTPEGKEAKWPDADVVIGNPPFLGGKLLITNLGEEYVRKLFDVYKDRVPHQADLVCYWFLKAGEQVGAKKSKRVGLVATNSIRGGANRRALQMATDGRSIFSAWSDEPWVVDGAAVRVSLVCFSREDDNFAIERELDGEVVDEIYTDLTARYGDTGIDLTKAQPLVQNASVAFMGDIKGGPFDIPGDLARKWLQEPANPHGRPNSDVLTPWTNGKAVTGRPADKWIIDFGLAMPEEAAALYETPFQYALKHVRPIWEKQRAKNRRKNWYLHHNPRPNMWGALSGLSRYIATPCTSKHRVFVWLNIQVCPSNALIAIAREDDTTFGILHSRFHEIWSLRMGTWLGKGNDPRYTPTTTFGTFPFPDGLSPDIPSNDVHANQHAQAIASAARRLGELRDRWLNPPEWVKWVDEPTCGYPRRPIPRNKEAETKLKKRTLTNLYNAQPQWLVNAHVRLDNSVAAAYGWPATITDNEALRELLTLNLNRR